MSSLRIKCIEYIRQEGNHLTYQEIAAGIKEGPQKVRTALADASKEGYIKFGKDESTGQGGYSLTGKGSSYLQNNKFSINGKSVAVNTAQCAAIEAEEHKRALAAKPAKQAKPTPKAPKAAQVEDEKIDAPEAGALLLSLANKDLHDQLAGLAEMAKNIKKQKAELEKTLAKKDAEIKELHSALFNAQEQINLLDEQIAKLKYRKDEGVLSYMLADVNGEYVESDLV
jgi:DNA-binding MarR family transcriptional regulator